MILLPETIWTWKGCADTRLYSSPHRSVRPSASPSHFCIASGFCRTAPAQPSATRLPCIRPCLKQNHDVLCCASWRGIPCIASTAKWCSFPSWEPFIPYLSFHNVFLHGEKKAGPLLLISCGDNRNGSLMLHFPQILGQKRTQFHMTLCP